VEVVAIMEVAVVVAMTIIMSIYMVAVVAVLV